jgi:hypothetical protein
MTLEKDGGDEGRSFGKIHLLKIVSREDEVPLKKRNVIAIVNAVGGVLRSRTG